MREAYDTIHEITGGARFALVVMSFAQQADRLFDVIRRVVEHEGLKCIRADQVPGAGYELLDKVHRLLERAELVIAETTDPKRGKPSANVYYEIGYAVALGKRPILLRNSDAPPLPADLAGLEVISYKDRLDGEPELQKRLAEDIRSRLSEDLPALRDMLMGDDTNASFIITQPKRREEGIPLKRIATFGDRLGILGLLRAFGSVLGEAAKVDLLSSWHSADELLEHDVNLYFIGSQKVTPAVADVLRRVQERHYPRWWFAPDKRWKPKAGETESDRPLTLLREGDRGQPRQWHATAAAGTGNVPAIWTQDYGLIVRAPHPKYSKRLVLILAGLHSLGTGAACLAATRTDKIREIRERLNGYAEGRGAGHDRQHRDPKKGVLDDKSRSFWVLVRGNISKPDYLLTQGGVTIEDVGLYER